MNLCTMIRACSDKLGKERTVFYFLCSNKSYYGTLSLILTYHLNMGIHFQNWIYF